MICGIYRAIVVDNNDPKGQGRLKLKIPQILGSNTSGWAWPIFPVVLPDVPPPPGNAVWVMFESGDDAHPVWMGPFGTPPVV